MLLTKQVTTKWQCGNKNMYEEKGYIFTKYKDDLIIRIEDLPVNSHIEIQCLCDYCLNEGTETVITKPYAKYTRSHKNQPILKDACDKHKYNKQIELCMYKKGVKSSVKVPEIHNKIVNSIRKYSIDTVRDEFIERNLELISTEYTSPNDYLDFVCLNHKYAGIQSIKYSNFKYKKQGCKLCSNERKSKEKRKVFSEVEFEFKNKNFTLLSSENEYKNNRSQLKYKCNVHNNVIQTTSLTNLQRLVGCPICAIERNSGENNSNWQGGKSSLYDFLRNYIVEWKKDSMKKCNFKCVLTNERFDTIHHLYGFDLIVEEVLNEINIIFKQSVSEYSKEDLELLKLKCIQKHTEYPLGICLIRNLHEIFHKEYGFGKNVPKQFEEFKTRYYNFEFDDLLEDKYKYCNVLKEVS